MSTLKQRVERAGIAALKAGSLRRLAHRTAARQGRSLALLYHRVGPGGPLPHQVVATFPLDLFRRQVRLLAAIGDIVPLAELLDEPLVGSRPRFAITFDDDCPEHVEHVLPVLQELGAHATFFLSGRVLSGLGPYWWELIEVAIQERGVQRVATALGLRGSTPGELADRYQWAPKPDALEALVADAGVVPQLQESGIRTLADAGMGIGFHTVRHPVMTTLDAAALDDALTEGRDRLAEVTGSALDLFAYPHGQANREVAERVRAAGFRGAFTTKGYSIRRGDEPFLLGRWEPRARHAHAFERAATLRLNLPVYTP